MKARKTALLLTSSYEQAHKKRILLSALIGIVIAGAIFQVLSGSEAARTPTDYPLVCRGGGTLDFASSEGKLGFTFTHGTGSAADGLLPGQCSWVDRRMYDAEPYRVSEPTEEVLGAPKPAWYGELRSSEKYWTFMVSNNGKGQLIVTSSRPGGIDAPATTTTGFTPSADGVESFETYQYYDEKCFLSSPPVAEAVPGTNLVGYINHWHDGGLLGCTSQYNTSFRGTVWFDLDEIFSKPSPKANHALLTFKKILAVANDGNGKPITRTCHDVLQAASEDWMTGHPYLSLPYTSSDHIVAGGAFDFSAKVDSCPPAGCSIDVTNVVNSWIAHPETRNGFVISGEDENFLAKQIPKTNDACETRYGDFRLTVNYTYSKTGDKLPDATNVAKPGGLFPGPDKTAFAPVNLALKKLATQISTNLGGEAYRAVDGNTDGVFANGSVAHTKLESQAWWEVDLGSIRSIQNIKVWNRVEGPERTSDFYVFVSDEPFKSTDLGTTKSQPSVRSFFTSGPCGYPTEIAVGKTGRYVRVQLSGANYLQLAEVEVFARLK